MANGVIGGSAGAAALAILLAFAPSPSSAAAVPANAAVASAQSPQDQLAAALAADMQDVRLQVSSADLDAGKPAKTSVVLPRGLLARIRAEAGKLNLDKAADKVAVRARLSGDGYDIAPNDKESARLTGRATGFHWKVKRSAGAAAAAPLNVHLTGVLHGDGPSKSFVLADLTLGAAPATTVTAPAPAAVVPAPIVATPTSLPAHGRSAHRRHEARAPHEHGLSRLKLPSFSFSAPDLGGVKIAGHRLADLVQLDGMPPQKLAIGAGLLALAVLLWAVALGAAKRKARDERRRRFRTFEPPRYFNEPSREA